MRQIVPHLALHILGLHILDLCTFIAHFWQGSLLVVLMVPFVGQTGVDHIVGLNAHISPTPPSLIYVYMNVHIAKFLCLYKYMYTYNSIELIFKSGFASQKQSLFIEDFRE